MKPEKSRNAYRLGSHCIVAGCNGELPTHARTRICPKCRGNLYRYRTWSAEHVREHKARLQLRQARMSFVNEERPKATVTIVTEDAPPRARRATLSKSARKHDSRVPAY
jgi:hypothetical protein